MILIIGLGIIGMLFYGDMQGERYRQDDGELWIVGTDVTIELIPEGRNRISFTCEVAYSPPERALGLSDREDLPDGRGMLFVYEYPAPRSFWMRNVSFDLDIIFIDENGIVLNVEEASPGLGILDGNLPHYYSDGHAKYVLEINGGISDDSGIVPGTPVDVSPF